MPTTWLGTTGDKEPKDLTKALGQLTNGVVETWEAEVHYSPSRYDAELAPSSPLLARSSLPDEQDVAKLLRVIPRSPYFSLAEAKEYPSGSIEWSPRELGTRVSPPRSFFLRIFHFSAFWSSRRARGPTEA